MNKSLARVLTPFKALLLVISLISPASAFFIAVPTLIAISGTGAVLNFILAITVSFALAAIYGELASAFPVSGGEYTLVGKTLGGFFGFITLIFVMVLYLLTTSLWGLGVGIYLGAVFGNLSPIIVGILAIAIATSIAIIQIEINSIVTGVFLAVELLLLLLITVTGFIGIERPLSDLIFEPKYLNPVTDTISLTPFGVIISAVSVSLYAIYGFGSAVFFAEETINARRKIAMVILLALTVTAVSEFFALTAIFVSTSDLYSLFKAETNIIMYFIEKHLGHSAVIATNLIIATAIFKSLIAIILGTARLIYCSARDNIWFKPLNKFGSAIHPKFASPYYATIFVGAIGALGCLISQYFLVVTVSTTIIAIAAMICIASIVGRITGSTKIGHYRMPLYPLPPILVIITLIYVVYINWIDIDLGRPSLIINFVIFLASMIYYFLFLHHRKDWSLDIPESNDE